MSPYRVLAYGSSGEQYILAAMLSVDKVTSAHNIYIVDKMIPELISDIDVDSLAYKFTTKLNSVIRAKYAIVKNPTRSYCVKRVEQKSKFFTVTSTVSESERTQANCLVAAMQDYMNINKLAISRVL